MLNTFPNLLPYGLFATTIIRLVIGFVLVYIGILTLSSRRQLLSQKLSLYKYPFENFVPWPLGIIEIITGGCLIIGLLTQISSLVAIYLFLSLLVIDLGKNKVFDQSTIFYIILILVSISLLFSGAGFLSVDLPL